MKKYATILFIACLMLMIGKLSAQNNEVYSKVKINLNGQLPEKLSDLGLEVFNDEYQKGISIHGIYNQKDLQILKDAGFQFEIIIPDMTAYYQDRNKGIDIDELNKNMGTKSNGTNCKTPNNFTLGSMAGYHTYAEILTELDEMKTLFPSLISTKQVIGSIVTHQNRPVYYVRISNNPENLQDKPKVLYTGLTHAREPLGMQQMLFQMWYLLENYSTDPEIQYLVDNLEMYFIPCVNPDGYTYNQTSSPGGGGMHRKNMRQNSDGTLGVDLNRNFGYMWGYDNSGSSPTPSSETYRGPSAFSEPESQIIKYFSETFPVKISLSNHTYSDILIYPWHYENALTPDSSIFKRYAQILTEENHYEYGNVYQTLNYNSNGSADDWLYAEQTTKPKIIAFTPEAGSASDGFWPVSSRIELLCAGHTVMNLNVARLATKYARVSNKLPKVLDAANGYIPFEIECLGIDVPADFTVSVEPISSYFTQVGEAVTFENMECLQVETDSISYAVNPATPNGAELLFVIKLSNGEFTWNDTIKKVYGQVEYVLNDPCNTMDNWTSDQWNITTQSYNSSPASITDSPSGEYDDDENNTITSVQSFDLSNASMAFVEFYAKWITESGWDYVQFMVSTNNGQTWTPLEGLYTIPGGSNQPTGQPLYDGTQTEWVKEEIDLEAYLGQTVKFRFLLFSDGSQTRDGFYFDDFKIIKMLSSTAPAISLPDSIGFNQNETLQVNLLDYLYAPNFEGASFTWENNQNIEFELNNWDLSISNTNEDWFGEENVLFSFTSNSQTVTQTVKICCLKVNSIPAITGQQAVSTFKNQSKEILPEYLTVEDDDNSYPADFTLTIYEGENYTITPPHTITPSIDYLGMLSIPVTVSDGIDESEIFQLQMEVKSGVGIDSEIISQPSLYFSDESLIIDNLKGIEGKIMLSIIDMAGKMITDQQFEIQGNRIVINHLDFIPGIYVVKMRGAINTSLKFQVIQ